MLNIQKTIQFCGDSFCAHVDGYPTKLANLLNAKIVSLGKVGSAHEHAIQSFNPDLDYTVFCWTEANRIHSNRPSSMGQAHQLKDKDIYYEALNLYFDHVHDKDWYDRRQVRDLYWFDHEVLSKSKSKIIHCFGFKNTYLFNNGTTLSKPISSLFRTGLRQRDGYKNHLNTRDNDIFADILFKLFMK